ncbi:MAG TPA: GSU2403 family nucleotidyltransferase fold protein [Rhabdochlamydiaceae bacterium]|nr:GSU2403 family nucleotidyltransferase fold protein [Rhabdochlamydiaceae bacterium]
MKIEHEDQIITDFLKSVGVWRDHIVISGGYALFIYKLYLADHGLKNPPIGTRDIDSILPRRNPINPAKDLLKHLRDAGYTPIFKNRDIPAAESYVKKFRGVEIEIEFFTDTAVRHDKNKNVLIAGVVAQPLSYLSLSLTSSIKFQTYTKEIGRVVSPGAWIFHKGLTFTKRKTSSKRLKDLYGIWYVASQLGAFSEHAITEYASHAQQHSKWFTTLQNNLLGWLENASPLEWSQLETQDPSGQLKKLHFEKTLTKLI